MLFVIAFHKSRKEENRIPSPEPEEEPVQKPPPVFIMSGMEPAVRHYFINPVNILCFVDFIYFHEIILMEAYHKLSSQTFL